MNMLRFSQSLHRILWLTIMLISLSKGQETGQLAGQITNQSSGEPLIGVNIIVIGTSLGAATDIDGKYIIKKIPVGVCTVKVSGVGYTTKTITDVTITSQLTAKLDVTLSEEAYNM